MASNTQWLGALLEADSVLVKSRLSRRLIPVLVITMFTAEFAVMLLLGSVIIPYFGSLSPLTEALLDASLLVILVSPVLYYFFFRPILSLIALVKEKASDLREVNQSLEAEMAEGKIGRQQKIIADMDAQLQVCDSPREAAQTFSKTVSILLPEESGGLFQVNRENDTVDELINWGATEDHLTSFSTRDCWALRRGQSQFLDGTGGIEQPCAHLGSNVPAVSSCFPIMAYGKMIGLVNINSREKTPDTRKFEQKNQLIKSLSEHVGLALANLELRNALELEASHDPLTGLFNRRYMEEVLEREIARAGRSNRSVSLIMMDLDHFKNFNDEFGHVAGDILLRECGALLQDITREADIVCRYGGEEFLIIMPEASLKTATERAEEIRLAVKKLSVEAGGQRCPPVTLSSGVAARPQNGRKRDTLIRAVDAALYEAKESGRDRVTVAEQSARAA